MADLYYLAVQADTPEEREAARSVLTDARESLGSVEGYADEAALAALAARKIPVTIVDSPAPPPAPDDVTKRRSKRSDPLLQAMAQRLETAARAAKPPKTGWLSRMASPFDLRPLGGASVTGFLGSVLKTVVAAIRDRDEDVYRVTLRGSLDTESEEALRTHGIAIASYRRGAYLMFLTAEQVTWLRQQRFVKEIDRYALIDTLHSALLAAMERSGDGGEARVFDLILHRPADRRRVQAIVRALVGKDAVEESSKSAIRFRARLDPAVLAILGDLPWVKSLLPSSQAALLSDFARAVVGLPAADVQPAFRWNGSGETVAVIDSGIDRTHPDLKDQLAAEPVAFEDCAVDDRVGHGTHIAGIIAGTGAASRAAGGPPLSGIAPGAKLVVVGNVKVTGNKVQTRIPLEIGSLLDLAVSRRASIVNASWGQPEDRSLYNGTAENLDRYLVEHPDVLVVVAAGNEGSAPEGFYELRSVVPPGTAKNVLTVGASATSRDTFKQTWGERLQGLFPKKNASEDPVAGNADLIAGISSRGPTDFDSVKPDLVAPGTYVLGPRAKTILNPQLIWANHTTDDYAYIGGSSFAAPIVAGSAAVLRQFLRETRGTPGSAALLKAILIGAAIPLPPGRPKEQAEQIGFPDFDQGFGRVSLRDLLPAVGAEKPPRTLAFVDAARTSDEALKNKERRNYKLTVRGGGPLVVTLVWTDPPGRDVQNRLTLTVIDPEGTPRAGNAGHLFGSALAFSQASSDRRNTVLQVRIADADPGDYTVRVHGFNVIRPRQGFAVAAIGDVDAALDL